ncbi:MAG: DsbA family protein [Candidatus Aenigmatarchaeota archaeon]
MGEIVIKIGKEHVFYTLALVAILLSIINTFNIMSLSGKIAALTDNQINNGNIRETQPLQGNQPTANQQPSQPQRIEVSLDDDPVKGSPDAKVTIVVFSDFQCPFCQRFSLQTLPLIEEKYIKTGKVRFVYRDFPLSFHQYAQKAAEAAECANEQGKFWEYHDILFQKLSEWASVGESKFKEYAQQLGLDMQKFNQCLDSGKYANEVQKDYNDGLKYGVSGTPTFFINGIKIVGAQPYSVFEQIIEQELSK